MFQFLFAPVLASLPVIAIGGDDPPGPAASLSAVLPHRLALLPAPAPLPLPCAVCGFANSNEFVHVLAAAGPRRGRGGFGLRFEEQDIDRYSDQQLLDFSTDGTEAHSYDRRFAVRIAGGWGITDDFAVGIDVPWVNNQILREANVDAPPDIENSGSQDGLGDISVFGQWTGVRDERQQLYASVYAGLKLPTGDVHQANGDGDELEPDHQLGSGSIDPLLGVAASKVVGDVTVGASAMYQFATDGVHDSNLGDILRWNVGAAWSPSADDGDSKLSLLLELTGEWREQAQIDGAADENTGGSQVFIAPGVRVTWKSGWSWYGSFGLPIAENLKGEQADTDFRIATGVGFAF